MTVKSGVVLANCRPDTDLVTNPAVNIFISLYFGNCLYVNKFQIEVVDLNNVRVNWDVQIIGMVSGYEEIGIILPV
jgi:hypothetical protein